jgi:hypothetical protein
MNPNRFQHRKKNDLGLRVVVISVGCLEPAHRLSQIMVGIGWAHKEFNKNAGNHTVFTLFVAP